MISWANGVSIMDNELFTSNSWSDRKVVYTWHILDDTQAISELSYASFSKQGQVHYLL